MVRRGKVFELGNYPDKNFSLDGSEADESIATANAVLNDLEHKETVLSGKLGHTRNFSRNGLDVLADVCLPTWLDEVLGPEPLKVSLAFDENKRIVGNALTLNPRITDAQVSAAFAQFSQGDPVVPRTETQENMPANEKELSAFRRFLALFSDAATGVQKEPVDPKDAKIAELEAKLAKVKTTDTFSVEDEDARRIKEAGDIAERYIGEGRAKPAEKAAIVKAFSDAMVSDNPGVTAFSTDGSVKPGSGVTNLHAIYAARTPDKLAKFSGSASQIPASGAADGKGVSQERVDELLRLTDLGQTVIKGRTK